MLNIVISCEHFIFFLCECASISLKSQKLILELPLLHNMLNFTFYNSHIGDVNSLEFKWYCLILPIKRTNLSSPTYCKDKKKRYTTKHTGYSCIFLAAFAKTQQQVGYSRVFRKHNLKY